MQVELVGWIDSSVAREWGGYCGVRCSSACTSASYWSTGSAFSVYFLHVSLTVAHWRYCSTVGKWTSTHPSTLSSNKLVIFSLDTCPAASIIVFLFKVRVILQLLWCLWETQRESLARSQRVREKLENEKKKKTPTLTVEKGNFLWLHPSLWRSNR